MRIGGVVGVEAAAVLRPDRRDRFGEEVDRQPFVMRTSAAVAATVERARGDTGGDQTEQQPGEDVGNIELPRVAAVGEDHAGAEDRDGQSAHVVRLAHQHLAGPLADPVTIGIAVVDDAGGHRAADIGVLVDELVRHAH